MKIRKLWLVLIGLLAFLLLAWVPVYVTHQYNPPKEETKYVRPVFGMHTVSQSFRTEQPISAWEVPVRSEQTQTVLVQLLDEHGTMQREQETTLSKNDQWIRFRLSTPLPAGEHILTLRAPTLTDQTAMLIRCQAQSDIYSDGMLQLDGKPSYGDIGFRLLARVPAWKAMMIFGQITDKAAWRGMYRLLTAFLIAGVLVGLGQLIQRSQQPRLWIGISLLGLVSVTWAVRLPYLSEIEGVFGGDAFNYLSKAQALLEGKDPFAADARKGPVYSALLLPAFFTPNPLMWSRLVGITAAAVAVVLLTLLVREFGMRWELALLGGLLLAVNQDFIWESPNGLANTLYTALILAVALAFLKRAYWWMAVLLGLTFLTRYEGAVLIPIFWGAVWWRERLAWKRAVILLLITGAVMAIPQVSYIWSGQSGIRTAGDVLDDEGLGLARSFDGVVHNLDRFHLFLRSVWLSDETQNGVLPAVVVGLVMGGVWLATKRWRPSWLHFCGPLLSGVLLLALAVLLFTKSSEARVWLVATPFFLMGFGVGPWLATRRYEVGVLLVALAIHTMVIIQILPKARYFLPLIPFMALGMTFGLQRLLQWNKQALARTLTVGAGALLVVLVLVDGRTTLERRVERYNTDAAEVNVMIQTVAYLRGQHGNVGFKTGTEQAIVTFIPEKRRYVWHVEPWQHDGVASEREFITTHTLRYLVERAGEQQWQIVRSYPNLFEHMHTFDSLYGEARVEVYRAHPEELVAAAGN